MEPQTVWAVQRQRRRSLPGLCLLAAVVLYTYGGLLLSFGGGRVVAAVQGVSATAFVGLSVFTHRRPEFYYRSIHVALILGVVCQTAAAWLRGPSESNVFFYDGLIILAAGYLLSRNAVLVWAGLLLGIEALVYWAELATGRATLAQVIHSGPDSAALLVLISIFTLLFRDNNDRREAYIRDQYQDLSDAHARDEEAQARLQRQNEALVEAKHRDAEAQEQLQAQFSALKLAKAQADGLATELAMTNQALVAASEARGRFLANMSHEIRTPMNAVVGVTNLLLETELNREQVELAKIINDSSHALLRVLNDILDVSKLHAGRVEIRPGPAEVRPAFEGITRIFRAQALERGLVLRTQVDPDVPEWVFVDSGRVGQILSNYLSNAVKFTERGEICARLSVPRPGWLRGEVVDSGVGIPKVHLNRLFRSFEQLDSSTTRTTAGTGLGLSISKQLAELMGGEVGAHSHVNEGSTFWVEIPAPVCEPERAVEDGYRDSTDLSGMRVLVADDNLVNQRVAVRFLERLGVESVVAGDGQEALSALETQGPFDAVLMDCQMPRMDGYEATRRIRANPALEKLRVVALTASVLEEDVQRSQAAGMDYHLAKPYNAEDLRQALCVPG